MKNQLLCCLGLLMLFRISFAQTDKQWLVWNSLGKDGLNTSLSQNNYVLGNRIVNYFTLNGVAPALPTPTNPKARNDIFVIYEDGSHFNSRPQPGTGFFYNSTDTPSSLNHNFKNSHNSPVQYLYLTNRYEIDDPPIRVKSLSVSTPPSTPYSFDVTNANLLSANHDVAYSKDITVIIRYDSLNIIDKDTNQYTLDFSGLQRIVPLGSPAAPVSYNNNIFDPDPIFGSSMSALSAVYTNGTATITGESVLLISNGKPNEFVNLKMTSSAFGLVPAIGAEPTHNAVFTLKRNGIFVRALAEPIRMANDPNYLSVESICQKDDGSYIVSYHLEFENDGSAACDSLSIQLDFPSIFDLSCLEVTKWSAAGQGCHGDLLLVGNHAIFDFRAETGILQNLIHREEGIGFIEFKVGVAAGTNLQDLTTSLELENIFTYFFFSPFPIHEFRDLIDCKFEDSPNSQNGKDKGKKGDYDKNEKQERSDTFKYDDQKQVDNEEDNVAEGTMISEEPQSIGKIECFRPVTQGACDCDKGIPIWLHGVIALAGISLLYILLKKKKITPPPSTTP